MPSENRPKQGVLDRDFFSPPTAESLRTENEAMRQALETHDYATFSMWLQKNERELRDNPVEHAQFLARAATIFDAVGNDDGAVKLLLRAAPMVKGKDPKTEERLLALLQMFGGEEAVAEYAKTLKAETDAVLRIELDDVQQQYSEVSDELVALDAHDWKERTGTLYTDEERRTRIEELRATLQDLVGRRAELRKRLGLKGVARK